MKLTPFLQMKAFFAVSVLMLSLGGVSANAERVVLPSGIFYYQPAATVFGGEAAWVNPARLGDFRTYEMQLMADYYDGGYASSYGFVSSRDGIAMAYRHLDNPLGEDFAEYLVATGLHMGPLGIGASYRHFKEGPEGWSGRHLWNIGFAWRRGNLAAGAVFSNLNRGRINGERSEVDKRYSLAYRTDDQRMTLSVDIFRPDRDNSGEANFIYNLRWHIIKGLFLDGSLNSEKSFQFGIRANLLQYFVGTRSSFDRNGHNGRTTAYLGAVAARQPSLLPEPTRRLSYSLSGSVEENPSQPFFGRKRTPYVQQLLTVYRAADDPSIDEMVINLKGLTFGFGRAQELREAISFFRSRGKSVTCHISRANNLTYYVASAADLILMEPVGQLNLIGMRAELTFYAGTLEKLGVKAEILRIGDHKSAAESFTRRASTEENREQINRLLDDLFDQLVTAIADGRKLDVDSVKRTVDNGPFTSADALAYGLVDGLSYRDRVSDDFLTPHPEISFRAYLADTLTNDNWPERPTLAVVVAEGEVQDDRRASLFGKSKGVTPAGMKSGFSAATGNRQVKGVVLRINSPGGLALAGEQIYHTGQVAAKRKPVMVSMANVAASGGYYIAMPSPMLFANEGTITGSIGVFGGKVDLSGLYDKIDLGKELYTRGKYAGMLTSTRPFTDEERDKYYDHLKAFYDHFVSLVADNRSLTEDSIDNLARGKVWTGREALASGLIDSVGGIKQALDYTADRLGISEYDVVVYPRRRSLFTLPGLGLFSGLARLIGGNENPSQALADQFDLPEQNGIYARMPFDVEIE